MKLSACVKDPSFHPIACHNIKVFIESGRTELKACISFDTTTGEYSQYKYPIELVDDNMVIIYGKDETLYYEIGEDVPQELVDDWYKRELE